MSSYVMIKHEETGVFVAEWSRNTEAYQFFYENASIPYDKYAPVDKDEFKSVLIDIERQITNTRMMLLLDIVKENVPSTEIMSTVEYYEELVETKGKLQQVWETIRYDLHEFVWTVG